jgi:hypothetical protein
MHLRPSHGRPASEQTGFHTYWVVLRQAIEQPAKGSLGIQFKVERRLKTFRAQRIAGRKCVCNANTDFPAGDPLLKRSILVPG